MVYNVDPCRAVVDASVTAAENEDAENGKMFACDEEAEVVVTECDDWSSFEVDVGELESSEHSCGNEATLGRRVSVEVAEVLLMSSLVSVLWREW